MVLRLEASWDGASDVAGVVDKRRGLNDSKRRREGRLSQGRADGSSILSWLWLRKWRVGRWKVCVCVKKCSLKCAGCSGTRNNGQMESIVI